jgi:lysophospholipase L1-like esterase
MPKAFLAYLSDVVLGANGAPVSGATVTCYPTSAFAAGTLPAGGSPGVGATATAISDASGRFTFAALPPDDYHLLVAYTPLGGAPVIAWSYHVPIMAADAVKRATAAPRASTLPRALARLAGGLSVTIFCLGDDLTIGYNAAGTVSGGWVALLAAQLATLYPTAAVTRADPAGYAVTSDGPIPSWTSTVVQAGSGAQAITVVNGGVKGDTVLRALRRFANLTAGWAGSDVLIAAFGLYESGSGGTQQFVSAPDFASHLESLVNVTRTLTQAEIVLCTPHANPPSAANVDDYAHAARAVAARTNCDLVDIRQLWLDRYVAGGANDGYDPWLNSSVSRLFPTDAGHAAIASEIAGHFAPDTALPYAAAGYGAGKSWELARVPYNSSQVAIVGLGWALHGGWQGSGLSASGTGYEYVTSHSGDTATIAGRFVDLSMLCRRFGDCGQVSVTVDGGAPVTVDLYRAYPASTSDLGDANGASAPQDRVVLAHALADNQHTVVVTLLASKNVSSSGFNWRFDGFELGRWRRHGYELEAADAQQRLQRGGVVVPLAAASTGTVAVSFALPFTGQTATATVVACSQDSNYYCTVNTITNSGFNLVAVRRDGTNVTASPPCMWMAVG